TPDEVASRLQVSRQVVYNWINDGRLSAVKAGRTLRVPEYALDAFLQPVHAGDVRTGTFEPDGALPFDRFTAAAQAAAEAAGSEVRSRQHIEIDVEHLLWVLLQQADGVAQRVFQQLGIDADPFTQQLDESLAKLPSDPTIQYSPHNVAISPRIVEVLKRAEELANQLPDLQIDTPHILQAICDETDGTSSQLLHSSGVTPERLRVVLLEMRAQQDVPAPQVSVHRQGEWEQRIEQQLARIETELAAIRSVLSQGTGTPTS
ncbi:MAG TPA: Clp protease N-terminal domain-containing protein, partial [Anaerolineales bacterium]